MSERPALIHPDRDPLHALIVTQGHLDLPAKAVRRLKTHNVWRSIRQYKELF